MAKKIETATLQVGQSTGDGDFGGSFVWGLHDGVFAFTQGVRYLRLYGYRPGVKVVTSHGTIELEGSTGTRRNREFFTFSDSDRSGGSFPITGLNKAITEGRLYDSNGNPVGGITFSLDLDHNQLVASKKFTGAVFVDYLSSYRVYKYTPEIEQVGNSINYQYGSVMSFYGGSMTQYQVPAPDISGIPENREIYRVFSLVHVNKFGAWEVPSQWPSVVWQNIDAPRENKTYMEYERPHEIGYLRHTASVGVVFEQFTVVPERGPGSNYKIPVFYREADASNFIGTIWESSYLRLDKNRMKLEVNARWPGAKEA